ncbi:MAG: hypothetical protein LBJ91_01770, partial [Clostridiales Family XIII bacterium]|nr:hypothetical protein [Clostridiales Family XIII bacterium]
MAKESVKDVDPISRFLGKALHRFGLGTRAKLIIISIIAKVIPLIILAAIAWNQFVVFGGAVQKMAVADAAEALNDSAVENIERMTTDTARNVADFLYERDDDIRYAATMKPGKSAYTKFINAVTSGIVETGSWALAEDGMSWVQTESMREQGEKASSTNEENLDKGGWHSRPAEGFTYRDVPIFDEITFVDTEGKEQVKVISENSTKKSYPMDSKRKDVSKRENTYVGSEDYWGELQKLRPGDIYVSDVKGVYVPSHFIGMYTPKQMVIAAVNGVVTALDAAEEKTDESEALKNALAKIKDEDIAKIVADTASNEAMMQSVIGASLALIDGAAGDVEGAALAEQVAALKEKVSGLTFDPGNEAYAGKENPLGRRFEGIVRWATPVTG